MARLDGKVAIVTGAARGAGEVTARLLAKEGARVVCADILDERGRDVAQSIGAAALYQHLDITQEADWQQAVEVAETLGPLNVLVNNAAILHIGPIEQTAAEDFLRVLEVNTMGTFLGVKAAIDPMRRAGGGSIVNIASISGWHVAPGISAYAASKFGVRGVTKTAAMELGRYGIRVNCINPAMGNPEMLEPFIGPEMVAAMRENRPVAPVGRAGTLDDVAHAVLFLASDESSFFSGADFPLDGAGPVGINLPTNTIPGET
jgi:3alpha(or 20beta)-hydroxysteroid dehydrogenase